MQDLNRLQALFDEAVELDGEARAEAMTEFLTDLVREADPCQARGEDVTARQILETGREGLQDKLAGQPGSQATLQQVLGEVYYALGNSPVAEELLRSAFAQQQEALGLDAAVSGEDAAGATRGFSGPAPSAGEPRPP